ncbi:hypothetical protein HO133_006628 [Letharia lupina]|uniref:Fatty acid hydroxylase domain-containing protein n=1 Tax=Letharia lupina TaxID=560253 RepID=A0A8H6C6Y1_9LECA|nr:uncharacterized protein HO133_006628 [Letharia lupina]KAF6217801.1 hypothetical protein HO133_006628 [Letharia lupina]
MQAVLSIPALSFLVIPAFSSYGTTLNLLFFTLTWAILVKTNNPLHVEILGTFGIRLLFYILPSLGFLFLDSATPALAVGIKEHGDIALPMSEENGGKRGRWWKVALISIGNVLLGIAIQTGIELLFTQVLHLQSVLKLSTGLPMPWGIAKDLFLGLLLREVMTYVFHRYGLHSEQSPLTGMHTSWQHTVPTPFSLVAHYDHPIAYLIHVFLPTYLPAVTFRFHLLTYLLYLAIVSLEESLAYSGYNMLPSAFVLGGIARRQEKHLMGGGNGNYGCFGLVDFAMGTSIGEDLVDDVIDEAEEKQVAKKTKGKVKKTGKKVLKKAPKKKSDNEEEEEEEGERGAAGEEEDEDEDEEEEAPDTKSKGSRLNESGKRRAETHEDDANGQSPEGKNETPPKRLSRTRRGEKMNGEEDAEAGGQDEEIKAEQEKPRPRAKGVMKKSSQKSNAGSRPRRRNEEDDES